MQPSRAELNRLCECAICHDSLQNAHICPECSNPFCRKCITQWLGRHRDCPVCRKQINGQKLVKARIYEQVQEVIESCMAMGCGAHKLPISLFCWLCLECICVTCLFAGIHAGHKDKVVLCESVVQDLKAQIANELKWIVNREQEIAHAVGQHGLNVKKLTAERDRILGNVQEVLNDVKGQFEEACAKQQEMVTLLEADNNRIAELRRISEKWIKSEKIFENLPNIANMIKQDRYNSSHTKTVDPICLEFTNDLIPELIVFKLDITGRERSRTFKADPGFEFKVLVSPDEESTFNVSLSMTTGIAGEYLVALGTDPLVPITLELRNATLLGRVKPEPTSPSITITIELAKTYAQKCRQYREIVQKLEESVRDMDRLIRVKICWPFVLVLFLLLVIAILVMIVLGQPLQQNPTANIDSWLYKLSTKLITKLAISVFQLRS